MQIDKQSWHERWQTGRIGFHRDGYHAGLVKYWDYLHLPYNDAVFVPLCGKAKDMVWLAERGHTVIGVELSPIAARDFFTENGLEFTITQSGKLQQYSGGPFTILVGDFFDITKADLPNITAVYDRAAMIALPARIRALYAQHLKSILKNGTQILLITLEFDQSQRSGPPFSLTPTEVNSVFSNWCEIHTLEAAPPEDFRGPAATEYMHLIQVK